MGRRWLTRKGNYILKYGRPLMKKITFYSLMFQQINFELFCMKKCSLLNIKKRLNTVFSLFDFSSRIYFVFLKYFIQILIRESSFLILQKNMLFELPPPLLDVESLSRTQRSRVQSRQCRPMPAFHNEACE